jgi:putative ABC transport system permease protein
LRATGRREDAVLETIRRDLRLALRQVGARPAFALVVVLTLALGIGSTTAVFSLVNSILLRPLPFLEPDRLVRIQTRNTETGNLGGNVEANLLDWRRESATIESIAYNYWMRSQLTRESGPAIPVRSAWVNADFFSTLRIAPILGRTFVPDEDRAGGDIHKLVLSYDVWHTSYGGEPDVLGRRIRLDNTEYEVIGVLPRGFRFPGNAEVWGTLQSRQAKEPEWESREVRTRGGALMAYARLRPGATLERAQAEVTASSERLGREYPATNRERRGHLVSLADSEIGDIRRYAYLLSAAVGMVLLICCVNVANLMLARAAVREREMAVRLAIGATRAQLVRQLLTESVLLSVCGGLVGLGLAYGLLVSFVRFIPVERPFWMRFAMDTPVLAFAFGVAVVTGVLFGLAPAIQLSATDVNDSLKEGAKGSSGGSAHRVRRTLVVAEVALSLVLLVGAGLLLRSFMALRSVDVGFQPEHVLTAWVSKYRPYSRDWVSNAEVFAQFHHQVLERLQALPGVAVVGGSNTFPFTAGEGERGKAELVTRGAGGGLQQHQLPALTFDTSPGFFRAMGIPLLRGREFDERDRKGAPMTLIVNQRTAEKLFPGRDAIGQSIKWGRIDDVRQPWCEIVGIVGNIRYRAAESDTGLEFYYPYRQWPTPGFHYVLRTTRDPDGLAADVRQAVASVDRDTPVIEVKTMDRVISDSIWQRRLWGALFAAFAVLALALSAVGIYGVMSYLVSQRAREIGIRMALGSSRSDVVRLIASDGMQLVALGVVTGLVAAVALARALRSLLYGVTSHDPATMLAVPALLALVALVACLVPARRASRIDPLVALRQE